MNFCWCTITVRDMEESIKFYTEIVGLAQKKRFKPAPPVEIVFLDDQKGNEIELIKYEGREVSGNKEGISIGFAVDSLDETMSLVKSKGIVVEEPPVKTPTASFFFVKDPNGVNIQFVEKP